MDLFDYDNFCCGREKGIGMLFGEGGTRFLASEVDGTIGFLGQDVGWIKGKRLPKMNFSPGCRIYDSKRLCKVVHAWMNLCIGNYSILSLSILLKYFILPNVLRMTEN